MKKAVLTAICFVSLFFLFSCKSPKDNNEIANSNEVTFINKVNDADVWILTDTEENRKTTLWGTATVSNVKKGESRISPLCESGDDGHYMFRMIDADGFFYSAGGIVLQKGWTVEIKGEALQSIIIEVTDENGALKNTYKVFSAKL